MRRGLSTIAALAALGGAVPAVASADCVLPKGVYTAGDELSYQTALFDGQTEGSVTQIVAAAGDPTDKRGIEDAVANVSRGNAARAQAYARALVVFANQVTTALATDPPTCTAAALKHAAATKHAKR